ncbi:MAG: hypothetical protein IT450_19775 [Phycisphaerales bacterium]|nr:hypothetical protein [Phycisphaerales bacterium]
MADERVVVRRFDWIEALPICRLFFPIHRALSFEPLIIGLVTLVAVYAVGRIADVFWVWGGAGVMRTAAHTPRGDATVNEIAAGVTLDAASYGDWKRAAREVAAVRPAETPEQILDVETCRQLIDDRVSAGVRLIGEDGARDATARRDAQTYLQRAGDVLRFVLAERGATPYPGLSTREAIDAIVAADPAINDQRKREDTEKLRRTVEFKEAAIRRAAAAPRGPFISLFDHVSHCASAAVDGAMNGRLGFQGGAFSGTPALAGSLVDLGGGFVWLVRERPLFALIFGLIAASILALGGGLICRLAAIQATHDDQSGDIWEELKFIRSKWPALLFAFVAPVALLIAIFVAMWVGGLVAGIPWLGPVLGGPTFIIALVGGLAMGILWVVWAFGSPLVWPTIAVEGSESVDALFHAGSFIFRRPIHYAFFGLAMLLYGAFWFILVRMLVVLALKLTHVALGAGMLWGSSWLTSSISPLDAMWHMPAWQDLPLLPALGGAPFWGDIAWAPLNGTEAFGAFFIAIYVFLFVGLVYAFALSLFFVGATHVYFLLRKSADGTDYSEMFYEGDWDDDGLEDAPPPAKPAAAPGTTPLPVMKNG